VCVGSRRVGRKVPAGLTRTSTLVWIYFSWDLSTLLLKTCSGIELEPSRTPAYFDLAALYKEMGHIDSAEAIYRKVLEVSPNDQEAISRLREITQ